MQVNVHKTKTSKEKNNAICFGRNNKQSNTHNVNMTRDILHITRGNDKQSIVCMHAKIVTDGTKH